MTKKKPSTQFDRNVASWCPEYPGGTVADRVEYITLECLNPFAKEPTAMMWRHLQIGNRQGCPEAIAPSSLVIHLALWQFHEKAD
jgi:hypothetical protein